MITAHTNKLALIGYPIQHSKSPIMMNTTFAYMGADFVYTSFNVSREQLQAAVNGLKALGFRGWNVTFPYKIEIQKYLDRVDETAKAIGAVNTVVNEDGKLVGYNTDGIGYLRSLHEETGVCIPSQKVMILGAGGAARAIGFVLAKQGAQHITIVNRSAVKAQELAKLLSQYTKARAIPLQECEAVMKETTLLINATPVGMSPYVSDSPVPSMVLHSKLVVSDLIYNPKHTVLLECARDQGANIHYGLGMLVHQAAVAIELWMGRKAPIDVMRNVLEGCKL